MALHSQVPDAKSIAFVSMGTGVYKWPMALAADIAVNALLTSTFEQTSMCVMDEATRVVYQGALDRRRRLNFHRKFFRGLLTAKYIYPPRQGGPSSPFDQSGTLFSNLALEPCLKIHTHGVRSSRSTVQDPHPSRHETLTEKAHETI